MEKSQITNVEGTPLIDLAPELFTTIRRVQETLAEWILPDSKTTNEEVLSDILGIVDHRDLVVKMDKVLPFITKLNDTEEKVWNAANIEKTRYIHSSQTMELTYTNGHVYQYFDIPVEVWEESKQALSIGSFMHRVIKGNYRYSRV